MKRKSSQILMGLMILILAAVPFGMETLVSAEAILLPAKLIVLPKVEVSRERVCLLDLCEPNSVPKSLMEPLKKEDIGEAPTVGSQKYILGEHLGSYLNRFFSRQGYDPAKIEVSLPERIIIERASMKLEPNQVEDIYRDFVMSESPWNPKDLEIRRIYFSEIPELPVGELSHEVIVDPQERFLGNVTVTLQWFINGEKQRSMRVTGKVDLYQNVIHALKPLRRNDIIKDSEIELQRINVAGDPDRFATRPEQVIGKQLLRDVGMHQPINLKDVDQPTAVKRGGLVTIVYQEGGLKLTAKGEATGDACIGDTIRVTNIMTNRIAVCRVVDGKTVHVVH